MAENQIFIKFLPTFRNVLIKYMVQAEEVIEERESVLAVLERECSERMKIFTFQSADFSKRGESYLSLNG